MAKATLLKPSENMLKKKTNKNKKRIIFGRKLSYLICHI
ncbi:hypothetical protein CSC14_3497 [Proteus mirabilis]|nr:hypothetical protein CSC14_3497 [Proteus mirabilis]